MGFRAEMAAARAAIHEEFSMPAFFSVSGANPVWAPITIRLMTKGDDPVAHMLGIFEIRQDNPVVILRASDAPDLTQGSLIACEYGIFEAAHSPQSDSYGWARMATSRMRGEPSVLPPPIPIQDD